MGCHIKNWDACQTLVAGFVVMTICSGVRRSTGLLFLEILEMCDVERSVASLTISCFFVTSMACSPLSVWLVRRSNTRWVVALGALLSFSALVAASFVRQIELIIVLVGGVQGLGHACFLLPTLVLVSRHFSRRRTLAVGLCGCGSAFGAFTLPPLVALSAERFAGPGMLLILAATSLNTLVAAALMRLPPPAACEPVEPAEAPEPPELSSDDEDALALPGRPQRSLAGSRTVAVSSSQLHIEVAPARVPHSVRRAVCRPRFFEVTTAVAFATFTQALSFFLVPPLAADAGLGRARQSLLMTASGVGDVAGRVGVGLLSDRFPRRRAHLFLGLLLAAGANWAGLVAPRTFASLTAFTVVAGVTGAATLTLMVPLMVDLLGLRVLDVALACLDVTEAVLMLVSPPLLSAARESAGSWLWGILSGVGCLLVSLALSARHLWPHVCARK